ncbi:hypothetical protein GUITHDRAFT_140130 [Guillardia theta CCMP2712]|uniref:AAA+ ATPase domain-containing protein n=1 Tax=Guillardia theta (strain CCMP2712) TaxID=905079 RepID=L1J7E2_GUITC|nr:hypothetical protein GUITHDRAFT_140130 [Guillardia theta CCMP2712]EKX44000.1 hypothetical protein GUITHDRAFT_140130 [Guillardia theta CCMP2712]|eukprot:XP_005830980.1 hypothetical protein GUITHDRAFT_140130 [Guillardia theta CCMP2712]
MLHQCKAWRGKKTQQASLISSSTIRTSPISSSTIRASPISSSTIRTSPISSSKIRTSLISSSTIRTSLISSSTIRTSLISSSTIRTSPISSSTIRTSLISSSTIRTSLISSSTIRTSLISSSTIRTSPISSSTIRTSLISSSTIRTSPISSSTIRTSLISSSTIRTSPISSSTIRTSLISSSTIRTSPDIKQHDKNKSDIKQHDRTSLISSSTIRTSPISSSTIRTSPISSSTIRASPISSSTIRTSPISSSTIRTSLISSSTIRTSPISSSTIRTSLISSSTIRTSPISSSTIRTSLISSSTIRTSPISSSTIRTSLISSSTIRTSLISSSTIRTSPISSSTIRTSLVSSSTIRTSLISSSTIRTSLISSSTIRTSPISSSTIRTSLISSSTIRTSLISSSTIRTSPISSKKEDLEQQAQEEEILTRLKSWTTRELEKAGLCVHGLTARPHGEMFGEKILELRSPHDLNLHLRKFNVGDYVLVTSGEDVWKARRAGDAHFRLDKFFSSLPNQRMREALSSLLLAAEENSRASAPEGGKRMSRTLQEMIVSSFCMANSSFLSHQHRSSFPEQHQPMESSSSSSSSSSSVSSQRLLVDQAWRIARLVSRRRGLVSSQEEALREAMTRSLAILQGPPGTGKTLTASCLAEALVLEKQLRKELEGELIVACAHSNTATDNLMEKLVDLKLRTVRVGRATAVKAELRHLTLEALMEKEATVRELRKELVLALSEEERATVRAKLAMERSLVGGRILRSADVVVASLVGSGHEGLRAMLQHERLRFHTIIVDEASQAVEPSLLIPLLQGAQPTDNLDVRSLFSSVITASYRRRMEGEERRLGSQSLDSLGEDRPIPRGFPWPREDHPLVFIDVRQDELNGDEIQTSDGNSYLNVPQAQIILEDLLAAGHETRDLGEHADALELFLTPRRACRPLLGSSELPPRVVRARAGVMRRQGREKEIILMSTVRSNAESSLGFLADWRRLNVAVTRARRGMIVVGDAKTLASDRHWSAAACRKQYTGRHDKS